MIVYILHIVRGDTFSALPFDSEAKAREDMNERATIIQREGEGRGMCFRCEGKLVKVKERDGTTVATFYVKMSVVH